MSTVIICIALVSLIAAIVVNMRKDRKRGKSSCGCTCSGCPMSGKCHSKNVAERS